MDLENARKTILKNTLWGKANILVRYLTSFIATAIIAANYKPEEFGFYQLILTYLAILESVNFLHPIHLRNHLVKNPEDEQLVSSLWFYQAIGLWVLSSICLVIGGVFSNEPVFWWLLLLGNIRVFFRAFEYMQIVADFRLRADLTQKIQMMMFGSFNISRTVFALLKLDLVFLVFCTVIHGFFSAIYQTVLKRELNFEFVNKFSWKKFVQLAKDGAWLSVVYFLAILQVRILSALVAERMNLKDFGNFQLVVKLVEPATSIGMVVFAANYTVLAHTLNEKIAAFRKRFFKISALSVMISLFCAAVICVFPSSILVKIFGTSYVEGIDTLWMGSGIIVANVFLTISVQYDMIMRSYRAVVFKYGAIFLGYVVYLRSNLDVTLVESILLQAAMPVVVVCVFDTLRWVYNKRMKPKDI